MSLPGTLSVSIFSTLASYKTVEKAVTPSGLSPGRKPREIALNKAVQFLKATVGVAVGSKKQPSRFPPLPASAREPAALATFRSRNPAYNSNRLRLGRIQSIN